MIMMRWIIYSPRKFYAFERIKLSIRSMKVSIVNELCDYNIRGNLD
jgi:hypothetical protein